MELPALTIVMTLFIPPTEGGFSRLQAAKQTILSWGRHMRYPGELRLYVANDTKANVPEIQTLRDFSPWPTDIVDTKGQGLGHALNMGIVEAFKHGPLVAYIDDSYSLVADLDLSPWASVLMQHADIGAVGLMPPRPEQQDGKVVYLHGIHTEGVAGVVFGRAGYNWNGRPLLYHERFFANYGLTPEGGTGYEWEQQYAEAFNALPDGPSILFAFHDPFQHVWGGVRLGDKPPGWDG